jgi:esterase/lipase superfamily enzyme
LAKHPSKPGGRPGTQIFYATNRDELADGFGMDAKPGQERRLILGSVQVEALNAPLKTEAPRDLLGPPDKVGNDDFKDPKAGGCAQVLDAWLAAAAAPKSVALLFIHGFSNSFNNSVRRAAQLVDFYAAEDLRLVPLVFCWPSDGKILTLQPGSLNFVDGAVEQYRRDQADAEESGPALARLLAEIRRARARQSATAAKATRLALLAHSMGNHVLAAGLLSLDNGLMTAQMRDLFQDAYLAAADVSSASFAPGRSLRLIAALASRVTVGISFDGTLNVASRFANGNTRLGHSGPDDLAVLPANVEVVDYFTGLDPNTAVRLADQAGVTSLDTEQHQWYRNDLNARADIAQVLAGKSPQRTKLTAAQKSGGSRKRHVALGSPD